jgi:hypothetical protein
VAAGLTRTRRASVAVALAAFGALAALVGGGCGIGASNGSVATFPPESFGPSGATTTGAVLETRAAIATALGAKSLQLSDPKVPFRPPEAPRFAAAPRAVYQVQLPNDPAHGFISVYEFPDASAATTAATEQANYVGSGVGRVQFPPDSRFVIRQLGTTVIFYAWSPDNAPDPRAAEIQAALETIGTAVAIPR